MRLFFSILCTTFAIALAFGAGKDWKEYHDKWVFMVELLLIAALALLGYLLR